MTTTSAKPLARGIDTVFYLARDLDRAIAFYRDMLGLEPKVRFAGGMGVEYLLEDGNAFDLAQLPDGAWYAGGGAMFAVADIEAAAARARELGVKLYTEIRDSPVCRTLWCEDSEGNTFALHQRKGA